MVTRSSTSGPRSAQVPARYLAATDHLDFRHPAVAAFVERETADAADEREAAVRLYYAVRDGLDYDVFGQDLSSGGVRASAILERGQGFCLHKSILYAAAVRAVGVPSRLKVSEVRNHLSSPRLRTLVGGDLFVHWLTEVHLGGRWVKATPVFNKLLCRLYGIEPLEFDGVHDASAHPFKDGAEMRFLTDHGTYADLDYGHLIGVMRQRHPRMFELGLCTPRSVAVAA